MLSEALEYLGDSYFYRGDYGSARQQYEKALQIATKSKSRELLAISRFNLAKLDVVQGRSASAITVLKRQVEEFDSLGLKAGSVQSSIYLAEALLATMKPTEAQQELDRTIKLAEKLGLQVGAGPRPLPDGAGTRQIGEEQSSDSSLPRSGEDIGVPQ